MNKVLIAAAAFATLLASPALAQSSRHQARAMRTIAPASEVYGATAFDPYVVMQSNHYVGRDPDANVRVMLNMDADLSAN